ncbi:hypothetical protein [Microbacterium sp. SLBN-146]|uniref:hypothetical protein n=1 Tax=Microbacterium sp. SLBN-146 TaxID=2768457 RepID=UPI0011540CD7|nr:hypothetical protein [Microbacterium sp. SLBN-146]TQJ30458.1 hypothetical protein FBY39_0910 [Microbacterium sp. SLBN-146]
MERRRVLIVLGQANLFGRILTPRLPAPGYRFVLDAWQPAKRCRLTSSHEFHRSPDIATGGTLYERIP